MWVEELGRELTGFLLSVWTGKNEDGTPLVMDEHKRSEIIRGLRSQAANRRNRVGRPEQPAKGCGCKGKG